MPEAEVTLDYVNPRQDRRPPSLKGSDGNYYTLSDAAYDAMTQYKGQYGQLSYYENAKGYRVATHWMGWELPRDQGGPTESAAANRVNPQPAAAVPTPSQPAPPPKPAGPPPVADKPPFGWTTHEDGSHVRTMPTVREQFIMKVVEATASRFEISVDGLTSVIETAKKAWVRTMENPQEPGVPEPPPPPGLPPHQGGPDIDDEIPF